MSDLLTRCNPTIQSQSHISLDSMWINLLIHTLDVLSHGKKAIMAICKITRKQLLICLIDSLRCLRTAAMNQNTFLFRFNWISLISPIIRMKKTCLFAIIEMNNTWILFGSIVYYFYCSTGHFIPINPPLPLSPSMILVLCFDASFPLNLRDLLMMTSLL